jgi:signal peptidase I
MNASHHHGPLSSLQSMLRATVVAVFVLAFLLQPYRIPSASMERTLMIGDFLLVNKQQQAPAGHWKWLLPYREVRKGDIVVFHSPVSPHALLVKRVVATQGDTLQMRAGQVMLNGVPQHENYAVYSPAQRSRFRDDFPSMQDADPDANAAWWVQMRQLVRDGELSVPCPCEFMMGDNRNDSQDSRYWGLVGQDAIIGQPLVVYFSVREDLSPDVSILQRLRHAARWRRTLYIPR